MVTVWRNDSMVVVPVWNSSMVAAPKTVGQFNGHCPRRCMDNSMIATQRRISNLRAYPKLTRNPDSTAILFL